MMRKQLLQALHNVGLEAVTIAREQHKYLAQTGNLQSSTGYVIVENGRIVHEDFKQALNGGEGLQQGKQYAKELASKESKGMQLIIVAGMPYAVYVEAMGLDVLDSAEVYARNEVAKKVKDVMNLWQQ